MSTDHDCIKRIDDQLAAHNTRIELAFSFTNPSREMIGVVTSKVSGDKRGKPMSLFATFCPFCGKKLEGA